MSDQTTTRRVGEPVREPIPTWKSDLEEFGEMYARHYREVRERLESYPSAHLRDLVKACDKPGMTNCGWTTYEVAPLVRQEARSILYAREMEESS